MKIGELLINSHDNIEQSSSIKKYISEDLYSTPEMQPHWRRIDEGFVRGWEQYLTEVALTPDQIQNIFKQAGGGAGGETPKDPGKLAALVDKVLPTSQAANLEKSLPEPTAGPVDGFEQKAGSAVQGLQGVDSGTKQSLMQLIKAGVQKPESQQLILAGVSAVLGGLISKVGPIISMIPGGGAVAAAVTGAIVAGGVAVIAAKLRGEDWKTAFKGAIKPALMGGAAAVVGNLVTTTVSTMMSGDSSQGTRGPSIADQEKSGTLPSDLNAKDAANSSRGDSGWNSMKQTNPDGTPYTLDQINQAKADLRAGNANNMSAGAYDQANSPVYRGASGNDPGAVIQSQNADDAVYAQAKAAGATGSYSHTVRQNADPADPNVRASIDAKQNYYKNDPQGQAEYAKIMGGGKGRTFEDSLYDKQATLKEWLRRDAQGLSVNSVQLYPYVVEGIMDSLKGMFGGNKGAAGGVTADALNKAWTAAGNPTDSEEIAKVLQSAGVPAETVSKVFADLKLPAPTGTATAGGPKEPTLSPEPIPAPVGGPKEPTLSPAPTAPAPTAPAPAPTAPAPAPTAPAPATTAPAPAPTAPADDELAAIKKNAGLPTAKPAAAPAPAAPAPIQAQPAGMRAGRFATKPLAGVTKPGARK